MSPTGEGSDCLREPKEPADGVMRVDIGPVGSLENPGNPERRKGLRQAGCGLHLHVTRRSHPSPFRYGMLACVPREDAKSTFSQLPD